MKDNDIVAFCIYDQPNYIGGPSILAQRVVIGLHNNGVPIVVIALICGEESRCETVSELRNRGVKVRVVNRTLLSASNVANVLQIFTELKPRHVVVNESVAAYYAACSYRSSDGTIGITAVIHSDEEFYHGIADEFITSKNRTPVTHVVCVSRFLHQQISRLSPEATHCCYIPPPLQSDVMSETSEKDYNPEKRKLYIYSGRFEQRQKRVLDVCNWMIVAARNQSSAQFALVGDGPLRAACVDSIRKAGLADRINVPGRVSNSSMLKLWEEAKCIVLNSAYEGLPIVLIEAMSKGVVPISGHCRSGIPDLIENGRTGLMCADAEHFSNIVNQIESGKIDLREMSVLARNKAVNECADYRVTALWKELITLRPKNQSVARNASLLPLWRSRRLARDDVRLINVLEWFLRPRIGSIKIKAQKKIKSFLWKSH